ncbi:hypothetical protein NA56DRAFT_64105 [Hyaloscypha hepaticicola]|uniref:Secreted protein n=1 Tax=Hyaloscypha hepaticicola TaxID=2082293 RepID=A0A2J6QAB6_9HELO|nr:hypothetical protein NA56DRAFT_64105 [Hyaloscypha hepaticicola]
MKQDAREPEMLLFRGLIALLVLHQLRHCSATGHGFILRTSDTTTTFRTTSRRLLPRMHKLSPFQSLVKEQCSASRLRKAMVHLKSARVLILSASKSDRDSIQIKGVVDLNLRLFKCMCECNYQQAGRLQSCKQR